MLYYQRTNKKNRYSNVLPSEKTRVKLKNHSDEEGSDYINANFIDGLIPGSEKTYIAAQGPLPKTFPDFWRMIWETNCSVIVMLTRLVENGNRLKCDRYFPEPDIPLNAGDFRISLYDITETPELTTRDLKIEYKGEKRNVYQFQYTAWPDHGLPPSTQAFLNLMHLTNDRNITKGPIVVHCSAGIGRSGVFCAVHSTIEKLKYDLSHGNTNSTFNMLKVILHLRSQRPGMIQTKEQYEFCYRAIYEESQKILNPNAKYEDIFSESDDSNSEVFNNDDDPESEYEMDSSDNFFENGRNSSKSGYD